MVEKCCECCSYSGGLVGGWWQWWKVSLYDTRGDDLGRRQRCHVLQGLVFGSLVLQNKQAARVSHKVET